jgi:hypothetical protein
MTAATSYDRERLERAALYARELRRRHPWKPLPGPQTLAYESKADVLGYGGAAGGGKTDLAIGKAITQHRRTIIVRKNGTEHKGSIDRLEEIFGTRDGFNGKDNVWSLDNPRRQTEFGSVPNLGDENKYRGRPHDLIVYDEAAEIPEQQIRFLMAWNRTIDRAQHCQTLLTFNPPNSAEGRWIIEFFGPWLDPNHPVPAVPGELRWFASIDGKEIEVVDGTPFMHGGELLLPKSRTFVPSRVTDNPYLVGTNYMATLQALPEPLRSRLLYGDFQAGTEDDAMQVIPTAWVDIAMARWKLPCPKPQMSSMGVDVARGGRDNTLIARRHNWWFDEPLVYLGTQTPDGPTVAGLVIAANRDQAPVHIDVIGVGSSPYDFLRTAQQQVIGINVSEKAMGTDKSGRLRFANQRSELWWMMREALDPQANNGIELPPDHRLRVDLCAPTWRLQGPIIQVESRDEIFERIGRSPDWASAYVLALLDTPRRRDLPGIHTGQNREYDPYKAME